VNCCGLCCQHPYGDPLLCVCNAQADWHWSLYLMKLLTYIFYLYISLLFRICLGPTCACRFFYLLMNQQGVLLLDNFTVDLLGWLGQKLKATFVAFTCAVTVIAALPRKWSLELVRTQEPSISISYLPHETGSSPVFPGVNLSFMLWLEVLACLSLELKHQEICGPCISIENVCIFFLVNGGKCNRDTTYSVYK
jgi:hypothetical protein